MNSGNAVAIGAIVLLIVGAFIFYQQQQAAAAAAAQGRTLGGAIANTIGGIGNIVGAAVNMGASGSGGSA